MGLTVQHRSTLIKQYFWTRGYSPGIFMSSGQIVSTQSSFLQFKVDPKHQQPRRRRHRRAVPMMVGSPDEVGRRDHLSQFRLAHFERDDVPDLVPLRVIVVIGPLPERPIR